MVARSITTQLLGTVVAVLGGWLAPFLFFGGVRLLGVSDGKQPLDVGILVGSTIATSIFMAWFIIPVWVLVLIPLYLFVPLSSPLWRWPVCTACGATAGFLIMALVFIASDRNSSWSYGAWEFCGIATLVGGATYQALAYAETRARLRTGEIRIFDSTGNVERVIAVRSSHMSSIESISLRSNQSMKATAPLQSVCNQEQGCGLGPP